MPVNTITHRIFRTLVPLTGLAVLPAASAEPVSFNANLAIELRQFFYPPQWPGQDDQRPQPALSGETEFRWRSDSGNQRAALVAVGRADSVDDHRNLLDLQEAYWAVNVDDYELLVGNNIVFWGVTESVHLVDIINQTDGPADIDGEQKLGQPMVNLSAQKSWGAVSLYLMPWFREREFSSSEGRLRTPLPVDADHARYQSDDQQSHLDWALRYSQYLGDFDLGLSGFSGTSRDPRFELSDDGEALVPVYEQIHQLGVDVQYTRDAWLWKLEAMRRETPRGQFNAAVAGFEYTRYQLLASNLDLGYLLEYQYDNRDPNEALTLADNDIFAGVRLTLNDTQDTALLAGLVYDHDTHASIINIEGERRLGSRWFAELRLRAFTSSNRDPIYSLNKDDYLQVSLRRYF